MPEFTFKVFLNSNGHDTFERWISNQSAEGEEKIRALIKRLSNSNIKLWDRPFIGILKGPLRELIIKADKQYRPIGCFGPGPQVFTLLLGATKESKNRKVIWDPPNAIDSAMKRQKLIKDAKYVGEYKPGKTGVETTAKE